MVLLVGQSKDSPNIWEALGQNPDLSSHVEDIRFTRQLGALTQNHIPLVQALQQRQPEGRPKTLRDFMRLDLKDWLQLIQTPINGKPIGFPTDLPGANVVTNRWSW